MLPHTASSHPIITFTGTPESIGLNHGRSLKERIETNIDLLVHRDNVAKMLKATDLYQRWLDRQMKIVSKEWPWLLTEMEAITAGAGLEHSDILKLNFPVWSAASIVIDGRSKESECSVLAITLSDGTVALGSTLDDWHRYYAGPVKYAPDTGHSFICIGCPGTCFGGRGINSAGLCVGTASHGLEASSVDRWLSDDSISLGLALRVVNQTCSTVCDVREFCKQHRFSLGLICVDATGDVLCAHQTPAGLYEMPFDGYAAASNSISDDRFIYALSREGYEYLNPEQATTRYRRGSMLQFGTANNNRCTLEEVATFISTRDDDDRGSIHNKQTAAITLGCPQAHPAAIWVQEPNHPDNGEKFIRHDI